MWPKRYIDFESTPQTFWLNSPMGLLKLAPQTYYFSVFEEQLSKRYTGVTINGASIDNTESTNPFEEGSGYNSEGNPDGSNSQSELSETKLDKKLEQKKNNPFNKDRFEIFSR